MQVVRHGFGIQIYPNGTGRYAGDWQFNKKTGEGHMVYQDGSEYRGSMINSVKSGFGLYIWPKNAPAGDSLAQVKCGHIYLGNWKNNAMNGTGRFLHADEFIIDPLFRNNLVMIEDNNFVSPFMTKVEVKNYL